MNPEKIFTLIANGIKEIVPDIINNEVNRNSMLPPLGLGQVESVQLIDMIAEKIDIGQVCMEELLLTNNLGELADTLFSKIIQ